MIIVMLLYTAIMRYNATIMTTLLLLQCRYCSERSNMDVGVITAFIVPQTIGYDLLQPYYDCISVHNHTQMYAYVTSLQVSLLAGDPYIK